MNNEYLTPEKVRGTLDSTAITSGPRLRDFVTTWVNASLLYEEAKARGIDRSSEVNEPLAEMKKQLAVTKLIESEVYTEDFLRLTDEEVQTYYQQHKNEYQLTEDIAKVRYVVFGNRDAANTFRLQLTKGKPWADILQTLAQDSVFASSILQRADSDYVRQGLPPGWLSPSSGKEFWRAVSQLQTGETTPIMKIDGGYYVLTLLGVLSKGGIAELPMLEREIRDRVLIEKRRKALEQFLERLRRKYAVQVNLAALEAVDTTMESR